VLIDPIGAIIAFVMLEIVLWANGVESGLAPLPGFGSLFARLALGTAIGVAGGLFLSRALKVRGLIPEGLANVLTLTVVLALYQVSETVWHESGIAAVTAAGVTVRLLGTPVEREMIEFKEQLTVMLIGMLFVLLAADVRMQDVISLGTPGLLTAAALIILIRPLNVLISTAGTTLSWQQRAFLSWIGPRGIVAAAVASLFAVELEHAHIEGGTELRALVFLVIASTVIISGLTGGFVANTLGLRRPSNTGWVILGAHRLAQEIGTQLMAMGQDVLLVDANPDNCHEAQEAGFDVRHGNGLKDTTLGRLALDTRTGVIGITANEEVNFLFAQKAKQRERVPRAYIALRHADSGVTPEMVHELHAHVLFGVAIDMVRWENAIESGRAQVQRWRMLRSVNDDTTLATAAELHESHQVLALVVRRGDQIAPAGDSQTYRHGDEVIMVVNKHDLNLHEHRMRVGGWEPVTSA
jgi:NhaP-type Na+/H+ or K+/H+ antiporter